MPVTAKLSHALYERLGNDVANELVEWFNSVDTTYRGDLRELNELNFARFDAKLEQRTASLDAKIGGVEARLDARFDRLQAQVEQRFAEMKSELLKWMFLFWATNLAALVAIAAR
jgi:hypothetical protein